jgi:hypothetical protein
MKERVDFGANVAYGRSRAGRIILEIIATALIAAALGTSHAQSGSEVPPARVQPGPKLEQVADLRDRQISATCPSACN